MIVGVVQLPSVGKSTHADTVFKLSKVHDLGGVLTAWR
jgi:hypothetical protein